MKKTKKPQKYGISRYFLLTMLLSFLGWAFETVYVRIYSGVWQDRGFMFLPFCPIYGCCIIAVYFFIGTPTEGRFLLKRVERTWLRYLLYLAVCLVVPTLTELTVGLFFDKTMHVSLWSYDVMPLHAAEGYICLPVSLAWALLLFLFMRFLFLPLKKLIGFIPKIIAVILAILLLAAVAGDTVIQVVKEIQS